MTEQEFIDVLALSPHSTTSFGDVVVYTSPDCPPGHIYMLNPAAIHFEPVHPDDMPWWNTPDRDYRTMHR